MAFTCYVSIAGVTPKHRNHLNDTAAVTSAAAGQAVEAYSDTTSAFGSTIVTDSDYDFMDEMDMDDFEDSFAERALEKVFSKGSIVISVFFLFVVLLVLFFPVIIVVLVLRYLISRHNARVSLAEKAMEQGQPLPAGVSPEDKRSNEYLWKQGITNTSVGVGLMVMFLIWESTLLMGVGALVACYGVGQLVIVKTTGGRDGNQNQ